MIINNLKISQKPKIQICVMVCLHSKACKWQTKPKPQVSGCRLCVLLIPPYFTVISNDSDTVWNPVG